MSTLPTFGLGDPGATVNLVRVRAVACRVEPFRSVVPCQIEIYLGLLVTYP